jgi:DNA-directed RNA polymerase specialized sigma24 family protein
MLALSKLDDPVRGGIMTPADLQQLSDRDLIKRYCSDPPDVGAGEALFLRCLPKIRKLIAEWGSNHLYHLPRTIDRQGFLEDAESLAADKLRQHICAFGFKGSFEGWLKRVAKSAAVTEYLKIVGRGPGPRSFVPLEEAFRSRHWPSPFEHVRGLQRGEVLRRLLEEHAKTSNRNKKSADAIAMSTWEGYTAREIAGKLDTTEGYTCHLISHDYSELRELMVEKLGVASINQI